MIKKVMQFRKTDEANETKSIQAENTVGGAGNAEQSGANDEAALAQGTDAATGTQPAQPVNPGTGFATSTSTGRNEGSYEESVKDQNVTAPQNKPAPEAGF